MALVAIGLMFLIKLDEKIPIKQTPFPCVVALLVWCAFVLSFEYILPIYHGINLFSTQPNLHWNNQLLFGFWFSFAIIMLELLCIIIVACSVKRIRGRNKQVKYYFFGILLPMTTVLLYSILKYALGFIIGDNKNDCVTEYYFHSVIQSVWFRIVDYCLYFWGLLYAFVIIFGHINNKDYIFPFDNHAGATVFVLILIIHFVTALFLYLTPNSRRAIKKCMILQLFTRSFLTTISLINCCIFTLHIKIIGVDRFQTRKKMKTDVEDVLRNIPYIKDYIKDYQFTYQDLANCITQFALDSLSSVEERTFNFK